MRSSLRQLAVSTQAEEGQRRTMRPSSCYAERVICRRLRCATLFLVLTVCCWGCSNDLTALFAGGPSDAGNDADVDVVAPVPPAAGGFAFRDAKCGACVTASCKSEATACAADPLCKSFWSCRAACDDGDRTCENRCRTLGWPWGGGAYVARESGELEACLAQRCDACDSHHIVGIAECAACAETACGDVDWEAYARSLGAQQLEACDASCFGPTLSDAQRLGQCPCDDTPDAEAVELQAARRACVTATCARECQGTPDLDCVGSVQWPPPVSDSEVTQRVIAWDYLMARSFVGASVSACSSFDPACASPLAGPEITDDNGLAELVLRPRSAVQPFADRTEVTVDGYRQLFDFVPRALRSATVWRPTNSREFVEMSAAAPPLNLSFDFDKGKFVMYAWDCSGKLLSGVQITTDPAGDIYYPGPAGDRTAAPAGAFVFNLSPGLVRVTATLDGAPFSFAETFVVAGQFNFTTLGLAPAPAAN